MISPAAWADELLPGEPSLGLLAGTDVRLFDPYARETPRLFADFVASTPMLNRRALPKKLAADLRASLSFHKGSVAAADRATYFVASFVNKTAVAPLTIAQQSRIARRYGETLLPQATCPVFAGYGKASKAAMLAAASALPESLFRQIPGTRLGYHRLFLLTELSHCGFLARAANRPEQYMDVTSVPALRAVIEAIGDYEATIVFRRLNVDHDRVDEADILFAARVVAMFLGSSKNRYASIPALTLAYDDAGGANRNVEYRSIAADVKTARRVFGNIVGDNANQSLTRDALTDWARQVNDYLSRESGRRSELNTERLLALFARAVAILDGRVGTGFNTHRATSTNFTLPGAARLVSSEKDGRVAAYAARR